MSGISLKQLNLQFIALADKMLEKGEITKEQYHELVDSKKEYLNKK